MTRWWLVLLTLAALSLSGLAARAESGARLYLPGGRCVVVWSSSESYEGGAQADPRLDRPVRIWQAGITLAAAFARVKEQTGVEIGLCPEGDENQRVRVNLYLSEKAPPSLRGLMAQLSWVVDCAFFYDATGGEDGRPRYCLMGTSMGGSVLTRSEEEQARAEATKQAYRRGVFGGLARLKRALAMSREDLIASYQGVDDQLLLTLLDPSRRAAVEFICAYSDWKRSHAAGLPETSPEGLPLLFWTVGATALWSELEENERSLLAKALGIPATPQTDREIRCEIANEDDGRLLLRASHATKRNPIAEGDWTQLGNEQTVLNVRDDYAMGSEEERDLQQLLGASMGPEQEAEYVGRSHAELAQRVRREAAENLEWAFSSERALSPEATRVLSAAMLPLAVDTPYALWEVQESLARESGLSIVSDCFSQQKRSLQLPLSVLGRGSAADGLTATDALGASCHASGEWARRTGQEGWEEAWEWGDAGRFLRFRSANRDRWRKALLPGDALDRLEALVPPNGIEGAGSRSTRRTEVRIPVDLRLWSGITARLDDVQVRRGGLVVYGDPADPQVARRQTGVAAVLGVVRDNLELFRFFGTLSDYQWRRLLGEGLDCGRDLGAKQMAMLREGLLHAGYAPDAQALVERVVSVNKSQQWPGIRGAQAEPTSETYVFHFVEGDQVFRWSRRTPPVSVRIGVAY
jgi:hypothetical protein